MEQDKVFYSESPDGSLSDEGVVNELLQYGVELSIRDDLIRAGILREIKLRRLREDEIPIVKV